MRLGAFLEKKSHLSNCHITKASLRNMGLKSLSTLLNPELWSHPLQWGNAKGDSYVQVDEERGRWSKDLFLLYREAEPHSLIFGALMLKIRNFSTLYCAYSSLLLCIFLKIVGQLIKHVIIASNTIADSIYQSEFQSNRSHCNYQAQSHKNQSCVAKIYLLEVWEE